MDNQQLKEEVRDVLENNILKYWITKVTDPLNGGYYGRVDGHDRVHADSEKGAILNARILWAFSAAYRVLRKPEYLKAARRAYDYIRDYFIDHEQEASSGASTARAHRSTRRSRHTPSASPFTA